MKRLPKIGFLCIFAFSAAPLFAQGKMSLASLQAKPAQEAMYKLSVTLEHELAADAQIVLDFPEKFDLSTVKIAGSNEVPGGIQFETGQNKLTLKRTGLGKAIAAGKEVAIIFGPLKNPDDLTEAIWANITLPAPAASNTIRQQIQYE